MDIQKAYDRFRENRLARLKARLNWDKKEFDLKANAGRNVHSLLWVWEFSKKAVLICFVFYIIVQIYVMVVMAKYCDFTHLGELISKTGEIVENCVFAYLMKSGVENIAKILKPSQMNDDEPI